MKKSNINIPLALSSRYSIPDLIRLTWSLFITFIFFNKARLIRQPTRIRGYRNILFGKDFTTGQYCRIEAGDKSDNTPSLIFGNNVQINDKCHIGAFNQIKIGNNVLIASGVFISDHDHGSMNLEDLLISPASRRLVYAPVTIEDNVWIGENVVILKGVKIGSSSVIAAGAVVTSDVPSFSLAAGVPARIIKQVN
ncbi:DapH/DapD/GlmU-related protein [Polynucleobacter nymphae]|uniref:DapH/DapD/GlmU-related protein n=1 Tax=Polynucleobacter nymphae TaxID=2081043 RepID=UPI001C0B2A7A|nr:DapH/DapD/GlmU-related protein [Polynucleobacter nymphae]MBU3607773.1 acetyltransferase [Polynucleobacter nymphae]